MNRSRDERVVDKDNAARLIKTIYLPEVIGNVFFGEDALGGKGEVYLV
jgi:hypothetical protein